MINLDGTIILTALLIMLMPLAMAGLALIHQGLGRSRSAAHTMLATLCAVSVAAIAFILLGELLAGYNGGASHFVTLAGIHWNWLGAEKILPSGPASQQGIDPSRVLVGCFEMFAVGIVALIPISTGSDRWRLAGVCIASAATAAITFPLFAHWVWGGGWLWQIAQLHGSTSFADGGGAGVLHVVGGFGALSVAWVLGPRKGKYEDGIASAIPGHNIAQVMFGCFITLVGWFGVNGAAALLFVSPRQEIVLGALLNTPLAAASGLLAAVVTTRIRYRKPDASISANGWVAGLVAGSAGTCYLSPWQTIFIGLVAGALVAWLVELFEMRLLVDDPGGAISVHAGAGLWGLLAFGLLRRAAATCSPNWSAWRRSSASCCHSSMV